MGYASKAGRAYASPTNPISQAVCDRCSLWYQISALSFQHEWRGNTLQNTRFLVCRECLDIPQDQNRAIILPPDPDPTINARVEPFLYDETDYQTVTEPPTIDFWTGIPIPGTTTLLAEDGQNLTTQPIGDPNGLTQSAIMPLLGDMHYGVELDVLSVITDGTDVVRVSCRAPHGLVDNSQVALEGLANFGACGFYSVTILTATAFTYQVNDPIPTASLVQGGTRVWTAKVGLPRGYEQIPQTGTARSKWAPIPPGAILTEDQGYIVTETGGSPLVQED